MCDEVQKSTSHIDIYFQTNTKFSEVQKMNMIIKLKGSFLTYHFVDNCNPGVDRLVLFVFEVFPLSDFQSSKSTFWNGIGDLHRQP